MGLFISSPKDAYVKKNTNVYWEGAHGQTAYELMYKLKNIPDWNTLGRVFSTENHANLSQIYERVETSGHSFSEIHYRVKVYTTEENEEETVEGEWYSEACNLIFKPDTRSSLNAKNGAHMIHIPLFEKSTLAAGAKLNARAGNSELCAPLVNTAHPLSSGVRVTAGGQTLAAAYDEPVFTATGIGRNAYMAVSGRYYEDRTGTGYENQFYSGFYKLGPEYYENNWMYYYICRYYYVYNGAVYYIQGQYNYAQTKAYNYTSGYRYLTGYYIQYESAYYYYTAYSAGWMPVWTYGYYSGGSGYYYYYSFYEGYYNRSYRYEYSVGRSYNYRYYING